MKVRAGSLGFFQDLTQICYYLKFHFKFRQKTAIFIFYPENLSQFMFHILAPYKVLILKLENGISQHVHKTPGCTFHSRLNDHA